MKKPIGLISALLISCILTPRSLEASQAVTTYYASGAIKEQYSVDLAGKIDGQYKYFYETGGEMSGGAMSHGAREGLWISFDQYGNLVASNNYFHNIKNGLQVTFYAKKKPLQITPYDSGKISGFVYTYFPDGSVESIVSYKNDIKDGWQFLFFESGSPKSESQFVNGKEISKSLFDDLNPEITKKLLVAPSEDRNAEEKEKERNDSLLKKRLDDAGQ